MSLSNKLSGKKLLILGASVDEVSLVKRAQSMGIYTIVTDYYNDFNLSPAKKIADEYWNISWTDYDKLYVECKKNGVDGITAGYSEFRIEALIKLCKMLSLPCYVTMEQLDITRDKKKFKNVCRKNGVPVVNEYACMDDVKRFPVIVKPVDRGGSIGISIANNYEELLQSYNYAMEKSVCKEVIIEDYICNGNKIDIYYGVEKGIPTVLSTCDTINASNNGFKRVVQSSWLYPEKNREMLLNKVGKNLESMIKDMGISYGCIFFSGFITPQKQFIFFECGFRLEGGHQYNYTNLKGNYNFLDLFIIHALTGTTELLEHRNHKNGKLKCVTINIYAKAGEIKKISGVDKVNKLEDCTVSVIDGYEGMKCNDDRAILTKIGMFSFCNEDVGKLKRDVDFLYNTFSVIDTKNNDMIYDRIQTEKLLYWW